MKVPICEVDIYIVAGSWLEVKKLIIKKSRPSFGSRKRKNTYNNFNQINYYNVNYIEFTLYSDLLYDFSVSLIFFRDIFTREDKTKKWYPKSEKSNPKISIYRTCSGACLCCCHDICRRKRSWCYDISSIRHDTHLRIDKYKCDKHHRNTDTDLCPLPHFSSKYPWIEYTTDKSDKWKYIECVEDFIGNGTIFKISLWKAKVYYSKEYKSKNNTHNTNVAIWRFGTKCFDKFEHRKG